MVSETEHIVSITDARNRVVEDESVDLVVTSPPYPMVEMWDSVFTSMNNDIQTALSDGDGTRAFELMHCELDRVWEHVADAVRPGGIVCVNVGDATRSLHGRFQSYPNTSRITQWFFNAGFDVLPRIYWQKPTNSPTSFLGSGTLPPNAYPKAEHEHILLFRNGEQRTFPAKDEQRYESAYFFEERNTWFSDQWDRVGTASQDLPPATQYDQGENTQNDSSNERERSGAYSLEVPYRLINMFSVYDDVVYDPFVGTGTTTIAAMITGRNSVGAELDEQVAKSVTRRVQRVPQLSRETLQARIDEHIAFLESRLQGVDGNGDAYTASNYPFQVVTRAETEIKLYEVDDVRRGECSRVPELVRCDDRLQYRVAYSPYSRGVPTKLSQYHNP